jgi:hypothetical protein
VCESLLVVVGAAREVRIVVVVVVVVVVITIRYSPSPCALSLLTFCLISSRKGAATMPASTLTPLVASACTRILGLNMVVDEREEVVVEKVSENFFMAQTKLCLVGVRGMQATDRLNENACSGGGLTASDILCYPWL